jgi:hypothetical protein
MTTPLDLFFTTTAKADNNSANDAREIYLSTLAALPPNPADERFTRLQDSWVSSLKSFCPTAERFTVKRMAGRGNNYDFAVTYYAGTEILLTQKVEFKHNACEVTGLPQFLSLASHDLPLPVSYAAFYYEHWLPMYVATDPELVAVGIPDRALYLAKIHSDKYSAHPLFAAMKARDQHEKVAKNKIVNDSIATYLATYGQASNLAAVSAAFWDRQAGKKFLLWDRERFHVREFAQEELTLTEIVGIHCRNTLRVRSATRTFSMLLRWKNHKGVMYPAWQIRMDEPEQMKGAKKAEKAAAATAKKAEKAAAAAAKKAEKAAAAAAKKEAKAAAAAAKKAAKATKH